METTEILTQQQLKKLYTYNPITGIFTRNVNIAGFKTGTEGGWASHKYLHIRINGRNYKSHRLAFLYMTGAFPMVHVDHINHIRNDNRWKNLREASILDNNKNLGKNKNNSSGVNGVSWNKLRQRWCVYISVNNKTIGLGRYKTLDKAKTARENANSKYNFHKNHCV